MTPGRFAGRRALVTGASRGIGAALATELARQGARVALTARTAEGHPTLPGSLADTAGAIAEAGGGPAVTVVADLADPDDRARIVPEAEAGLGGPVEILVNNAAAAMYQPLADFPLKRRRLTFEVNVHAPLDLAQAAIPAMVERGEGWIVNVSSGSAAHRPAPFADSALGSTIGVYGASKAALNRLTNALAEELWGTGVRVNTVEPRAAVHSEGADAHLDGAIDEDLFESMDDMVAGALALCDCPPERTGGTHVSLDLIGR